MATIPKLPMRNAFKKILLKTLPLYHIPYPAQLAMKQHRAVLIARTLGNKLMRCSHGVSPLVSEGMKKFNGLPCELERVRPVKTISSYRNKQTMSAGFDEDGNVCLGHSMRYTNRLHEVNRLTVAPIFQTPGIMSTCFVEIFSRFHAFLPHSKFPPFVAPQNGNWCSLMVRNNHKDECLLHFHFHPQDLCEAEIQLAKNEVMQEVIHPILTENVVNVKSVQWLTSKNVAYESDGIASEVLWGQSYIEEPLLGKIFRISARSFFQTNTEGATVLYTAAGEMLRKSPGTLLLDICCGTGTLGIILSDKVEHVIGIDWEEDAITDAKYNAKLNNVVNIEHHCEDVETFLARAKNQKMWQNYDHIVAIVNPHRNGLTSRMMRMLRSISAIKQVIYLSCRPEGRPLQNFYQLSKMSRQKILNEPFIPKCIIPLDPFPGTKYVELVLNFER